MNINTRGILASFIVVFSFGYLYLLCRLTIPSANQPVLNTAAGLILGAFVTVVGFYFGSSKNESDTISTNNAVTNANISSSSTTTTTTTRNLL